eukprot:12434894-Ditylum_brightwellii.AAC.1
MMKVLLAWKSQVTKHSEKQGSLPKKIEKSNKQAAGSAIIKSSPTLFLYAAQEEKRQEKHCEKMCEENMFNSKKQVRAIGKSNKCLDKQGSLPDELVKRMVRDIIIMLSTKRAFGQRRR